mgnify:CR=1 FL=1
MHVIVDDQFPCLENGDWAGMHCSKGQSHLWMMVLEKAYAKLYGGYDKIQQGDLAMALQDLIGA